MKGQGDYESDLDSNIDSQSFDSENNLADFTKEQFETDFQYVESRVFTDVDNTKHIVILDMKNNSRLLIEANKLLRYCWSQTGLLLAIDLINLFSKIHAATFSYEHYEFNDSKI